MGTATSHRNHGGVADAHEVTQWDRSHQVPLHQVPSQGVHDAGDVQDLGRGAERLQPCHSLKLAPLSFRAATYFGVFARLHMLTGKGPARHGHILREATRLVEVSWLVAEQYVRLLGDSLRDRDALLLSAGHLRGKVVHSLTETDHAQCLGGVHCSRSEIRDERDVLARSETRDEVGN